MPTKKPTHHYLIGTEPVEPPPGSVVITNGATGTAWQRLFSDGRWHSVTGKTASWKALVEKALVPGTVPLLLVHETEIETEPTYRIVRFYRDDRLREVIDHGLTLEQAKEHCNRAATHDVEAGWFDGWEEER